MTTISIRRVSVLGAALAAVLCAGCGRQQNKAPGTTTNALPAASQAEHRHGPATHAPAKRAPLFVSADGRVTNAVYESYELSERLHGADWNQPTFGDLAADYAAQPDNPDTWYRLGMAISSFHDPSNRLACFEKTVQLAPDALRPRLMLALTLVQLEKKEAAYVALTAAHALVSSPAEMEAWVHACRDLPRYGSAPSTELWAFVRERSGDAPLDTLASLLTEEKPGVAVDGIGRLLASSTNEAYRATLMSKVMELQHEATNDPGVKQRIDALIEQYSTPYERAMQKIRDLPRYKRGRQDVALCRNALEFATNTEMRLSTVLAAMGDPDVFRADPAYYRRMIEDAIGSNGWDSPYACPAIAALMHNGAADTVRAMVAKTLDASPSNPACVLVALRSMEGFGGMFSRDRGDVFDLDLLALARARFPSNEAVLRVLAHSYNQAKCIEDELACRRLLRALAPAGRQRAADAVELLALLVRQRKFDEACQLARQVDTCGGSNAQAALAVSACMLATGRTNEACDLLMAACRNQQVPHTKIPVLQMLLATKWPGLENRQRTLRFAMGEMGKPAALTAHVRLHVDSYLFMNSLYPTLVQQLVDAGMYDETFACTRTLAQANTSMSSSISSSILKELAKTPGGKKCLEHFTREMLAGSCTQAIFFSSLAPTCLAKTPEGRKRIEQFAREMLAGSCTQAVFFSSLAPVCASAGLRQLSLELNVRGLQCGIGQYQFMQYANEALSRACELKDTARKNEIIALIDQEIRSGRVTIPTFSHLRNQAGYLRVEGKLDEWLDILWQQCTNKTDYSTIQQMIQWYMNMDRGMTSRLAQIIAPLALDSMPPQEALMLIRVYRFLGDHETAKRLLDTVRLSLTNSEAITGYGSQFLNVIRGQGLDASGKVETRALLLSWMANSNISAYERLQLDGQSYDLLDQQTKTAQLERFLNEEGWEPSRNNIRSMLMERYVESGNSNGFVRLANEMRSKGTIPCRQLSELCSQFERMHMPADAIVMCKQALEAPDAEPDQKANLLMRAARLHLGMEENDQAIRCVEDALAAAEERGQTEHMIQQAATLFLDAGKPQKGMDILIQVLGKAASAQDACTIAQAIASYAQRAKLTLDMGSLIAKILSLDRSVQTYAAIARMLEQSGDAAAAKSYMQQALGCAQTDDEKRTVYESLRRLAQASGDRDAQIQALEQLMELANDDAREHAMSGLASMLIAAGDYTGAVTRLGTFLASGNAVSNPSVNKDYLRKTLFDAQMTLDDKEAAWATAQTIQNWSIFLNAAQRLGRRLDALPRLEQEFASADPEQCYHIVGYLLSMYKEAGNTEAIAKLADAMVVRAANGSPQTVICAADVLERAGRTDDAIALLKKFSGNEQSGIDDKIVSLLRRQDRADEAIAWLDAQPQSYRTLRLKAEIRAGQGKTDEAIELFCAAMEGVDDEKAYHRSMYANELGALVRKANDPAVADRVVARLLKGDAANDPSMRQQAATLYQQIQRYDDAAAQFEKAANLVSEPRQKQQYIQQYAQCCVSGKKYEEAISVYNGLLKNDSLQWQDRDQLRSSIASVYQQSGRESQAFDVYKDSARDCEAYIGTIKDKNEATWARFRLAELYHQANDDNEAVRVLKKVAEDFTTGPNAQRAAQELKRYGH